MMSGADPGTQMNPDEPKLLAAKLKKCKKDRVLDRSRQAGPGLCDVRPGRSWAGPGLHDIQLGRSRAGPGLHDIQLGRPLRRQASLGWQVFAGQASRQASKPQPICAFF